eukprot:CAMPEP_0198328794 /NCGR_PEP_ID=MMETSP1450-20131203/15704_1 /TAXON_ID=753684 ORGANISM="Madagascaria erythrocladiodes, Strain CCMP3234" /NCGR_SAMPLE_ID=MMETSP1450 /ASSEMBLY_ACC=CAM_ASM_001115 /LENGTH=212 /DNA_ID=CAMNT_0044032945 /DNA_START=257 /DNA_END=897 /DNA_ORIENTATION=-
MSRPSAHHDTVLVGSRGFEEAEDAGDIAQVVFSQVEHGGGCAEPDVLDRRVATYDERPFETNPPKKAPVPHPPEHFAQLPQHVWQLQQIPHILFVLVPQEITNIPEINPFFAIECHPAQLPRKLAAPDIDALVADVLVPGHFRAHAVSALHLIWQPEPVVPADGCICPRPLVLQFVRPTPLRDHPAQAGEVVCAEESFGVVGEPAKSVVVPR